MNDLITLIDQYESAGKAVNEQIGVIFFKDHLQVNESRLADLIHEHNLTYTVKNFDEDNPYRIEAQLGGYILFAIYTQSEFEECFPELIKGDEVNE